MLTPNVTSTQRLKYITDSEVEVNSEANSEVD